MDMFLIIFGLIFAGAPIAFAFLTAALVRLLLEGGQLLIMVPMRMSASLDSFPLIAVPFFILAAEMMNAAKITDRLFAFCRAIIGPVRGGLAHVNVLGSMVFAGMSGSAVADASGLGKIEVKAMIDEGYDRPFTAAITAASSIIGPIIPPSIGAVILGYISGVSVGALLLAGIIPGISMGLVLMLVVAILAWKRKYPRFKRATWAEFRKACLDAIGPLLTPVILVGGIVSGVFSPTEAAVVCAIYATLLGVAVYRVIGIKDIYRVFARTALDTGVIFFLAGSAQVVGAILVRAQLPEKLFFMMLNIIHYPALIVSSILIIVIILGCIIDDMSILLILGPIVIPLAAKLGFNPVHFGILFIVTLCLGMITPPVGIGMYIVCYIAKVKMAEFAKEIWPMVLALIALIFTLLFLPKVVLFIPRLAGLIRNG
jgi:tripartite ATP-independent transporter DctM subunit